MTEGGALFGLAPVSVFCHETGQLMKDWSLEEIGEAPVEVADDVESALLFLVGPSLLVSVQVVGWQDFKTRRCHNRESRSQQSESRWASSAVAYDSPPRGNPVRE